MEFHPRCPSCSGPVRWEGNASRPFCSERCKLADLGAWITEQYRVPGSSLGTDSPDDDDSDESSSA